MHKRFIKGKIIKTVSDPENGITKVDVNGQLILADFLI